MPRPVTPTVTATPSETTAPDLDSQAAAEAKCAAAEPEGECPGGISYALFCKSGASEREDWAVRELSADGISQGGQTAVQELTQSADEGILFVEDAEFMCYLERKLLSERNVLVAKMQRMVDHQVSYHHRLLLKELREHVGGVRRAAHGSVQGETPHRGDSQQLVPPVSTFQASVQKAATKVLNKAQSQITMQPQPDAEKEPKEAFQAGGRYDTGGFASQSNFASQSEAVTPTITEVLNQQSRYKSKFIAGLSSQVFKQDASDTFRTRVERLGMLIESPAFELMSCLAIILNVVVMALEVQYTGCRVSRMMNHPDCQRAPGSNFLHDSIDISFTVFAVLFCTFFTLEFLLRLVHLRTASIYSAWMWFDALILTMGMLDTVGRLGSQLQLGVNPTAMRAARIMRMLRMLKVLRNKETFHTLFVLLKSILASKHAFIWSVMLLYFTMTCCGLLINQLLYSYLEDETVDEEDRKLIFDYFGTYTRMIITMFEITLGNWAPPSRLLMAKVSQWWGLFITIYRCIFCFALVNVTGAVFITETSRVASDDEVLMLRKSKAERKVAHTLREVFLEMDTSCDGHLTLEELGDALQDGVVKSLLEVLELQITEVEELFGLMDDGSGLVRQEDFVRRILEFRGPAKSIKQVAMMSHVKKLAGGVEELSETVTKLTAKVNIMNRSRNFNSCCPSESPHGGGEQDHLRACWSRPLSCTN